MPSKFSTTQIPSLTGKVALITGANNGIGLTTSIALSNAGAKVIMACRTEAKAQSAIDQIKAGNPKAQVEFLKLDLCDLKSVKAAAETVLQKETSLDLLINNAGIMNVPYKLVDGVEWQFLSNHLGHFLLTSQLLPILRKTAAQTQDVRIVNLSSLSHAWTKDQMTYDSLETINKEYSSTDDRYGQSKAANILFSKKLQQYVDGLGLSGVYVNSVHPGFVNTGLFEPMRETRHPVIYHAFIRPFFAVGKAVGIVIPPSDGCLASLYVATSPDIVKDKVKAKYFVPYGRQAKVTAFCQDAEGVRSENLWRTSKEILSQRGFTGLYP